MNQTANSVEVRKVSEQPIKITGGRLKHNLRSFHT